MEGVYGDKATFFYQIKPMSILTNLNVKSNSFKGFLGFQISYLEQTNKQSNNNNH